jgi:hypothetical protein
MSNVPDEFLCPISYEVMTDPVVLLEDGHTYERSSIEAWLARSGMSPMTNLRLQSKALNPNYALRSAIERWRALQQAAATATATAPPPDSSCPPLAVHAGRDGTGISAAPSAAPMPAAVIAILDRSGSMAESAAGGSSQQQSDAALFSRMDLVKHSLRTVAAMLALREASLGIVSFSDAAQTDLTVRKMDATGKGEAERAIEGLQPNGGTNIWAGLRAGLDQAVAYSVAHPGTNVHVILLTDGEPTPDYLPLQGIPVALKKKLATLKASVTLSCFGFGYNLDSKLLEAICVAGGGTYGYIPDCSMVGTVFINYCAAALGTVAAHVPGVGLLQAGQRKLSTSGSAAFKGPAFAAEGDRLTAEEEVQLELIGRLRSAIDACTRSKDFAFVDAGPLRALAEDLRIREAHLTPFEAATLEDLESLEDHRGQLLKAVRTPAWFSSWGLNHLLSYSRALACQQCVNFKDVALQTFAGPVFKAIQEEGNDIFDNLPPPVPSAARGGWGYGGGLSTGALMSTINMGAFNFAAGPCWDQWTPIRMEDGGTKYAKDVIAGERVWGGHRIRAVVRTIVNARVPMVQLSHGSGTITPWHPVRRTAGAWQFPAEIEGLTQKEEVVNFYYNMVLETGHVLRLGGEQGWETCTLGHGFTDGPVITHPYFGTEAVLKDLQAARGWDEGLVILNAARTRRDPETGLVCGLS